MPTLDTVRVVGGRRLSGLGRLDEFETRRLNGSATVSITRDEIVKLEEDLRTRLTDSIETAYLEGGGAAWAIQSPVSSHQSPVASHQSPVASLQSPVSED